MKLTTHEDGSGHILEVSKGTTVYFNNDWRQIFQIGRCNWYSFHFIYLYFEIDQMSKMYEVIFILLGLGFTMRIDRDFDHSEIKQRADEAWKEMQFRDEREQQLQALLQGYRALTAFGRVTPVLQEGSTMNVDWFAEYHALETQAKALLEEDKDEE